MGHFLTFDPSNNWQCCFKKIGIGGTSAVKRATFKVLKFGLAQDDQYNTINLVSFESSTHPNYYITLSDDMKIYIK